MEEVTYALDSESVTALELAKSCVPDGADIELGHLLSAFFHGTALETRLPALAGRIPPPEVVAPNPGRRHLAAPVRAVLARFPDESSPASPGDVVSALASSPPGRELLATLGLDAGEQAALAALGSGEAAPEPALGWRTSPERGKVLETLGEYGRTLTGIKLEPHAYVGIEETLRKLMQGLVQRKQHSVILVGPPGVGKTVVVHEFARRISAADPRVLPRLRDTDVFELSPAFLKAGASMVGQFEERIKGLIEVLAAHPQVLLFVDEVHSLLQSEMHVPTPWSGASAEFKKAVGSGQISLIGCTTLAEFRNYIEPDHALAERFTQVRIPAPTAEETVEILSARMPSLRAYYSELVIPDDVVALTVKLAEEHLLGREEPRKSIRLLDQACAWCLVQDPPVSEVTEEALRGALDAETGHRFVEPRSVTKEGLAATLKASIVGQDDLVDELAEAVVTGLGTWSDTGKGPRGNFFFAGPTGTGKTETAKILAEAIGGSAHALLRIDCNTLQGSGLDSREAISTLLGPPPGYIGYVRGEGGVLSRIRNTPDCVVLFDEIEKADPGVGKLLLQILDEGTVEDTDGNLLDFRRAFLVFTSNAGNTYEERSGPIGFRKTSAPAAGSTVSVSAESVMDDLRRAGFPQEFLGRGFRWFVFHALGLADAPAIINRQLEALRAGAAARRPPMQLDWEPEVVERLAAAWDPQFGARGLIGLLRRRLIAQLSLAESEGRLDGVTAVRVRAPASSSGLEAGAAGYERRDTTLFVDLY